jgi:YVTN family beta-propeller protein
MLPLPHGGRLPRRFGPGWPRVKIELWLASGAIFAGGLLCIPPGVAFGEPGGPAAISGAHGALQSTPASPTRGSATPEGSRAGLVRSLGGGPDGVLAPGQARSLAEIAPTGSRVTGAYIASTLVMLNGSLVPGNLVPPNGLFPLAAAYDDSTQALYVVDSSNVMTVLSTASDRVVGNLSVPVTSIVLTVGGVQLPYTGLAYDPHIHALFVTNPANGTVNVLSDRTNTTVANVSTGLGPVSVAYDPAQGELFVANARSNNVSVVSDATDRVVATVPVGVTPSGVAYDAARGEVFVANAGSNNVSVISAATNVVVATIPVSAPPTSLAVDDRTGEVYVDEYTAGNVTVISDSTNRVVANVTLPLTLPGPVSPAAVTFDSRVGELLVAVEGGANGVVWVNDSSHQASGVTGVGVNPSAVALDLARGLVFVTNQLSNNVSLISDTTRRVVASVDTGRYPQDVVFDRGRNEFFVSDFFRSSVDVFSASTWLRLATIPVPWATSYMVYDAGKGEIFADAGAGNGLAVISDVSNAVVAQLGLAGNPQRMVYDGGRGEVYVTNSLGNNVTVVADSTNRVIARIAVGATPLDLAYDNATGEVYVANSASDNVSVIADATHRVVTTLNASGTPDGVQFDPAARQIFVAAATGSLRVFADLGHALVATIPVPAWPGTMAFEPSTGEIALVDSDHGVVNLISDATDRSVATVALPQGPWELAYAAPVGPLLITNPSAGTVSVLRDRLVREYNVTFTESDLPMGAYWAVSLNGSAQGATSPTLAFTVINGSYPWSTGAAAEYRSSPTGGTIRVNGSDVAQAVVWRVVSAPPSYAVTFHETGLVPGTPWSVTVNGTTGSSITARVTFNESNGTYAFALGSVAGYSAAVRSGTVVVAGGPRDVPVIWNRTTPLVFGVEFDEVGLPPNSTWSVNLNGTARVAVGPSITFRASNGTLPYRVGIVPGYLPTPTDGNLTVRGQPEIVIITWTAASPTPHPARSLGGPSGLELLAGLGGIVGAAAVAGILLRRRRGRTPQSWDAMEAPSDGSNQ